MLDNTWLQRAQIEQHSLDMRQFVDFRQSALTNGLRLVEATNASGLSYTVLPDRGLDIWTAHYRGVPLTWISQGSPHAPELGGSWLRLFNGGLLTTCGLTQAGPPQAEPITEGGRDIHGLYTRLRAGDVAVSGGWDGEQYALTLRGAVSENSLFGEQLRLERTYRLTLDEPVIAWSDRVANLGDAPAPLMVLYHINPGYPLVRAGTTLHTPDHAVYPRDAEARKGVATWAQYDAAQPGYAEQVFWHHVKADARGKTAVALLQESFGLLFEWDTRELPYLTQWKNTRQGIYVCGIEPGNCLPEGQVVSRDKGRLVWLEPGETQTFGCALTVLDGAEAVVGTRERIAALGRDGVPVTGCNLADFAG
ncbi:MAG: aldose 1-epimerase family protein [Anaerolineae bacterium]|nr:aldose 1-epimerase family protein [Anaerolineae bacterium]